MVRPVLGNDPFATPDDRAEDTAAGVAGEPEDQAPRRRAPAPKPKPRTSQRRAVRLQIHAGDTDAAPAEAEAERPAAPGDLLERVDERIEERLRAFEARLETALTRLEAGGPSDNGLRDADAAFEDEPDDEAYDEPYDEADEEPAAVAAEAELEDEEEEEDFVGFLRDAPADTAAADEDEEFTAEFVTDKDSGQRRRYESPSFLGGLIDLFTPGGLGRRLGDAGMRGRSEEVDEFGRDPLYYERATQFFDWMYQKYWRVETEGLENVPADGRGLIVGNHSGTLPFDGVMIATAVRLHHDAQREVRALAEDMFSTLPFLAPLLSRVGAVRACPENAERLLRKDELVVVFPEGVKGTGKYFSQRYNLQRFGRGGFIKLCIKTQAPLIPVAVVGAEEIYPIIAKADWLGKPLGLPYTPITPTFPWLGLLGFVPLPSKWRIRFGEPMYFEEYGPDAIEDDILINHLKERVRTNIQEMINEMIRERTSVWFG